MPPSRQLQFISLRFVVVGRDIKGNIEFHKQICIEKESDVLKLKTDFQNQFLRLT